MTDLISRAVAIKAFTGKPPEYYATSYIVGELKDIPAVDAVPVMWCKDCKWWNTEWEHENGECYCYKIDQWTAPRFYCADGERR